MNIGTLKVSNGTQVIFEQNVTNMTISGGRAFFQIDGSFFPRLPFAKNQLYRLEMVGVEGMEGQTLLGTFEDYMFNAGSTETVDMNGNVTPGVCVLSNRLQFLILG